MLYNSFCSSCAGTFFQRVMFANANEVHLYVFYFLNPKEIKGLFINPRWRRNEGYKWKNENSIYKVKASALSLLSCIFEMLFSQRLRLYKFCSFSLSEPYNPPS